MRLLSLLPILLLAAVPSFAQSEAPDAELRAAEARSRIAAEREQLRANLFEQERACYQRFAVNDCLRKARRQQREALTRLRQEEVQLNDEARQRRAAQRQAGDDAGAQQPAVPASAPAH